LRCPRMTVDDATDPHSFSLVPEVTDGGENHGEPCFVGRLDDIVVLD
jgi:hypothetical protein